MRLLRRIGVSGVVLALVAVLAVPARHAEAAPLPCPTTAQVSECNLPYGGGDHRTMDSFFTTKTAGVLRPAVLFIHGGAWWAGDKSTAFPTAHGPAPRYLVNQTGWVAFSTNYRLSLQDAVNPWIDEPDDIAAAVTWIKNHANEYSVNPNRIAVVGHSAGGHLALYHAFRFSPGDSRRVKTVVSWAGPTDMVTLAQYHGCLHTVNGKCGATNIANAIRAFEGGCALLDSLACTNRYKNTSPLNVADVNDPEALLVHGLQDTVVPVEQANELKAKRPSKTTLQLCPTSGHTSEGTGPTLPDCAIDPTIAFLRIKL